MRALPLLFGAFALLGASCSTMHRFHESSPGLNDGAWRIGGFFGGLGESSDINGVDDDGASIGLDLGKVIGDSGEFGFRFAQTTFDVLDADVVSGGLYGRWYMTPSYGVRPLLELAGALGGIDYGVGDDTGWLLSAGAGVIWVLHDRFALELVLRQTYGDFETGDDSSIAELTAGISMFW